MVSLDCSVDFDGSYWNGFDMAMFEEWNATTSTACHEVESIPESFSQYKDLSKKILKETTDRSQITNFAAYIDQLLAGETSEEQVVFLTEYSEVFKDPAATGIAYVNQNMAFVRNNFEYSTGTLSHEILHLMLEEGGYDKECYVEHVHENQFNYAIIKNDAGKYPIVKKFDC